MKGPGYDADHECWICLKPLEVEPGFLQPHMQRMCAKCSAINRSLLLKAEKSKLTKLERWTPWLLLGPALAWIGVIIYTAIRTFR